MTLSNMQAVNHINIADRNYVPPEPESPGNYQISPSAFFFSRSFITSLICESE